MTINCEIRRSVDVQRTPRVQQLEGIFDVPPSRQSERIWQHKFTLPETWNIGVIVGPSGSGKSTLARQAFGGQLIEKWDWPEGKSILDGFPPSLGIREITGLLSSVGFSSPPSWLRPFTALSNGEQFRVNLARTLSELPELAVVDEFTSVVDRTAAKIGSAAVAKAVRRLNQKFVAVTCHYDVLDWLQPDWVYEPHLNQLTVASCQLSEKTELTTENCQLKTDSRRSLRQRPPIELEIVRVHSSMWTLFKPHHYLSGKLHPSSKCFLALYEGRPAAFIAALPFPHPTRPGWREHRCVCLPEFQGVGIGNAVSEFVAGIFADLGKPYFSTTSHPAMIRHRAKSPLWKLIRAPSLGSRHRGLGHKWNDGTSRVTAGFEYIGHPRTAPAA
jgi:ABC-type Mn2+/Zn2+ transport system ATPase subunit